MSTMSDCTCKTSGQAVAAAAADEQSELDLAVEEVVRAAVTAAADASDERYAGLETRIANLEAAFADMIAKDAEPVTELPTSGVML